MRRLALTTLSQFAFALFIGATGLFLIMTVAGFTKNPTMHINIPATIGMYFMFLSLGGLFFFVPGALSSVCSAFLFRRSPLRSYWTLFLFSAAIAFGCFYLVLTVHENYMRMHLNSVDGFAFFPSRGLTTIAIYTAPVAFGLAALFTRVLITKLFTKDAKKAQQDAAANP